MPENVWSWYWSDLMTPKQWLFYHPVREAERFLDVSLELNTKQYLNNNFIF